MDLKTLIQKSIILINFDSKRREKSEEIVERRKWEMNEPRNLRRLLNPNSDTRRAQAKSEERACVRNEQHVVIRERKF